jgi:hypothetical protein
MIKGLVRYAIALSEAMPARALRTLRIFSRIKYYSYIIQPSRIIKSINLSAFICVQLLLESGVAE